MIGVLSKPKEREVVEEFFQLFKTPWEFYNPARKYYDVLFVTCGEIPEVKASLILVYGEEDGGENEVTVFGSTEKNVFIRYGNERLPIYGKTFVFPGAPGPFLFTENLGEPVGYETNSGDSRILRIGFDLFEEVRYLLLKGQPPENALIPTLDLHIEMVRNWIIERGLELVEIPPVPSGYHFIACLTHDVDFIGIRNHFMDHSMMGFLYRATLRTLFEAAMGKIPLSALSTNLKAVISLPLVFLGMSSDPWNQFDRYLEIEQGLGSTYFFIPFKNRAGEGFCDRRGGYRAAKYDVDDVLGIIQALLSKGCEIGVHGIDAWHSIEKGEEELRRVQERIGLKNALGIRMHWLCQNEQSFQVLERAGYSYDSSFGYNETIGFRAGTSQPFRPPGLKHLLEIPLHIQDVALFSPNRINGSDGNPEELCSKVIEKVKRHEGVLTVLWHQRSLGPERLWGKFYEKLINRLREEKAWFGTAGEVAEWFRARRNNNFQDNH